MTRRLLLVVVTLVTGLAIGAGAAWIGFGALVDSDVGSASESASEPDDETPSESDDEATLLDPVPYEAPPPADTGGDQPEAVDQAPDSPAAEPDPNAEQHQPEVPPAPDELVRDLETLLAGPALHDVDALSIVVLDEAGREVAALQPDRLVMPASTAKLVTAAAAMRLLGPDFRYVTRAYATEPPSAGVVDGDLVVVGSGDPGLASPEYQRSVYPARPHTKLDDLAAAIERAGIDEIRGAVVGDPQLFADEPVAEGWPDRYFASLDATRVSGLTVDAGRRLFERDNLLFAEVADQPALLTAEVLTALLAERDVVIGKDPAIGMAPLDAIEVTRVRSPALRDLMRHLVQTSDNHMADGLFRTLGAAAGSGTWLDSAAAVVASLDDIEVDWSAAILADGSGLSRQSRLSARMLAETDRTMTAEYGGEWRDLLAVAGESGTLRSRLRNTIADGRFAGKTGALRDARSLAGQVEAPDGRRYHFAIAGSELDGLGIQAVRQLMDDLVLVLAGGDLPVPDPETGS